MNLEELLKSNRPPKKDEITDDDLARLFMKYQGLLKQWKRDKAFSAATYENIRIASVKLDELVKERTAELEADITERKRAEDELRIHREHLEELVKERTSEITAANKELEEFSYSASHDLRSPLRSIDGFSQVLLEDYLDKLDEQGKDYLQRIRLATQRMGIIIDDWVSLARVTRSEMRREIVDVSALVQSITADLQRTQPERQVDFIIAPELTTNGDAQLLRLLMENLLSNAWKFTKYHPQARIEFGATQSDGEEVFFVRDDGAGFDMTYADELFGAFKCLHPQDQFPGTGIGLSIVQRIVRRHGGRVWAEGKVEEGATFYFTLS